MNGVARIRHAAGGIILPSRTPYDRETVIDALRHALHRHGAVQLDLDGRHWRLSAHEHGVCAACHRASPRYGIAGGRGHGPLCAACLGARLSLTPGEAAFDPSSLAAVPLPGAASAGVSHSGAPRARHQERSSWHSTSSL